MMRIAIGNGTVAAQVEGTGDPVVALHGGLFVNGVDPLTRLLARHYRVIHYDRLGYGESTAAPSPYSVEEQARDLIGIFDALEISSAHLVAYSLGGYLALQLAAAAPARVRSIVLLEGGPVQPEPGGQALVAGLTSLAALSRAGSTRDAIVALLAGSIGPNYEETLDPVLPAGWFERAVKDASTYFEIELPAALGSSFNAAVARSITKPVLSVRGSESGAAFAEAHDWILKNLPNSAAAVLPGLNHGLQCLSATAVAAPVLAFLRAQPTN